MTTATDREILALVGRLAELNGGAFIRPSATYTRQMREVATDLVMMLGAPDLNQVTALRDHEFTAFYSVTKKNLEAGKRFTAKRFKVGAEPLPMPLEGAPMDQDAVDRLIALVMSGAETTATSAVQAALGALPELVALELKRLSPRRLDVYQAPELPPIELDNAHERLEEIITFAACRVWPFLVGPAGSGKTTLAENVAKALSLPFYFAAKVSSEFALLGFMNAQGDYVRTAFREAYENGGVFLLDEMDGSSASALTAFNAALANGICPFPDGMIARHPNFVAIAAGNTYGRGADRQYVGRAQLDAATLDRFAVIEVDYDEKLEVAIASNSDWTKYVQAIRAQLLAKNVRHIVSPRASIAGSKLIAAGLSWERAAETLIWKGLDKDTRQQVEWAAPITDFAISIL